MSADLKRRIRQKVEKRLPRKTAISRPLLVLIAAFLEIHQPVDEVTEASVFFVVMDGVS
jgi:hypothetical protein